MARRIVVIAVDGTETVLDHVPNLKEMQEIVGGYIEHVRVLRGDLPGFVFTSMFVNEEGLIHELPRNPKATALYQANVRRQYPGDPTPFATHSRNHKAMMEKRGFKVISPMMELPGYADDPWIAGPAIWFDGYTVDEADEALSAEEQK